MLEVRNARVLLEDAAPALRDVSCHIAPGELVAFIGANGSGKSTLARLMCAAQMPSEGAILVDGASSADEGGRERIRRLVGRVGQAPADQIISTVVADEVALGLVNLDLDERAIEERTARALAAVGLAGFEARAVESLSGGEQQRLILAAVLAMEPSYLVLDEPISQLDSAARASFRSLVRDVACAGTGVALITHDPLEALMCDRVYCLDGGRIVWKAAPRELLGAGDGRLAEVLPPSTYVDALRAVVARGYDPAWGVEPDAVTSWLSEQLEAGALDVRSVDAVARAARSGLRTVAPRDVEDGEREGLSARDVRASRGGTEVLHGVSLDIPAGEVVLVAGASGAGKTTLACAIAGLIAPDAGTVALAGRPVTVGAVGVAFQDPESQLFLESVAEELAFAPRNLGFSEERTTAAVERVARMLDVGELLDRDPFALSGGQARRVALGGILTAEPRALVLDEPSAGLDAAGRAALHGLVRSLARDGMPIMVVSHDLEEWLADADRVALMRAGAIAWAGTPEELDVAAFERSGIEPPETMQLRHAVDALLAAGEPAAQQAQGVVRRPVAPASKAAQTPAMPLASIDARVKVLLFLAAAVAVFLAPAPWALLAWLALALVSLRAAGVRARAAARSLRALLVLFVLVILANVISLDGSADIMLAAPFGISVAGAMRAGLAMARIIVLACLALAVGASTTPTELADAFVRLMAPLGRAGVPVGDIGLALSMALRLIPLVSREAERIQRAQAARGVSFAGGALGRVRAWGTVITPLVVGLFRRADRIAESMDARGFEPHARRSRPRPLAARDRFALIGGLGTMAAIVVASHLW